MGDALPIPPEPPPRRDNGKKRWNGRPGTRTKTNDRKVEKLEELRKQVTQLEEKIKVLTVSQMERDEAHAKALEIREKEREKDLSNLIRIYEAKMKRQQQKHVVEVTKVVEALNEMNEHKNEIKTRLEERINEMKTRLEEEREERKRQNDVHAQHMDMLQQSIVVMTQTIQVREVLHAKELDDLRKAHADRAKLGDDECKIKTAEIPTPTEKQRESSTNQQETSKTPQEHHQTTMKSSENYTVVTPVTIRECSETFDESQVTTPVTKRKPTTKKTTNELKTITKTAEDNETKNKKKEKMQEQYKNDKERKQKIPSKTMRHELLIHDAWNKKRRHRNHRADPFRFDPRYKKRKKPGRKDGMIMVPQQKQKKNKDALLHDAWSKKKKHKKKKKKKRS